MPVGAKVGGVSINDLYWVYEFFIKEGTMLKNTIEYFKR